MDICTVYMKKDLYMCVYACLKRTTCICTTEDLYRHLYTYVHMYICTDIVYAHVYTCTYIDICTCTYICTDTNLFCGLPI